MYHNIIISIALLYLSLYDNCADQHLEFNKGGLMVNLIKPHGRILVAGLLAIGCMMPALAYASPELDSPVDQADVARLTSSKQVRYPAEGGTWTYGNYGDQKIHSDYYHRNSNHGSSCQLDGTYNKSIDTRAGFTSYSSVNCFVDLPWTNDSYWYRIC